MVRHELYPVVLSLDLSASKAGHELTVRYTKLPTLQECYL